MEDERRRLDSLRYERREAVFQGERPLFPPLCPRWSDLPADCLWDNHEDTEGTKVMADGFAQAREWSDRKPPRSLEAFLRGTMSSKGVAAGCDEPTI